MRERRKLIIYLDGEEAYVNEVISGIRIDAEIQTEEAERDGVTLKINIEEEFSVEVITGKKEINPLRRVRAKKGNHRT